MTQPQVMPSVSAPAFAQISAGPGAIVSLIMSEVMDLYRELMHRFQDFTSRQIEMENNASIATATAARESGLADANSMWAQMGGSLANILATGCQIVGTHVMTKPLTQELTQEQTRLNGLKPMASTLAHEFVSPTQTADRFVGNSQMVEEHTPVAVRKREWEMGVRRPGPMDDLDHEAIAHLQEDKRDFYRARDAINGEIDESSRSVHRIATQIQTTQQLCQMWGQFGTGLTQAGSQAAQATFTTEKARQEETRALEQTQTQMAQQGASSTAQQQQAQADKMLQEIQALKQINDSAVVRA